jgi:uncharacterized protein (DUF2141 family)
VKKYGHYLIFVLMFLADILYADIPFAIEIHNVTVNGGTVYVSIYFNEESFKPDDARPEITMANEPNTEIILFEVQIPEGEYVIGAFQDANENGDMDYSIFRIPKEPYGFSNMRGKIPGNYNKLKYKIDDQNRRIIIPLVMF